MFAVETRPDFTRQTLWGFGQPGTMCHEVDDGSGKLDVDFCLQQVPAKIRL